MSHCRVLFVGTIENLNQIFADCPDSSSETCAEMTFAYDYLTVCTKNELLRKEPHHNSLYPNEGECEFSKADSELYDKIVQKKQYYDCFDIRDNTPNNNLKWELKTEKEIESFFESLPDNTHFFVCDGHL